MQMFVHKLQALAFLAGAILTMLFCLWAMSLVLFVFGDDTSPPFFSGWRWGLTVIGLPVMGALENTTGVQRLCDLGLRCFGVREQ